MTGQDSVMTRKQKNDFLVKYERKTCKTKHITLSSELGRSCAAFVESSIL
jgi:hypothetical protein